MNPLHPIYIGMMYIVANAMKPPVRGRYVPVLRSRRFPRNSNCPCGSGVKFKKCHGVNW